MNNTDKSQGFFNNLLQRTGGWYILIVIALAQLLSFPAAILGAAVVQVNANFNLEQIRAAIIFEIVLLVIGYFLLLATSFFFSRNAFTRLNKQAEHQALTVDSSEELNAWRQITNISWRYGAAVIAVSALLYIIPLLIYLSTNLGATYDQLMFTLFGGIVSSLSVIILSVLLIERMLIPARALLVPISFENQLAGATSTRIFAKFQSIILALVIVSILLIAPLGYHMAYTILYEEIGSAEVFEQLQRLSLIASSLALGLGFGLSFLLSRSVSDPVNRLIDVFQKVEQGDLKQRAKVIATDEIGSLAVYFNRMISQLEQFQHSLEDQVTERTAQLEATNEVGRVASSILDPDELIAKVVNLITDRFGYYYAALFIVEETGIWAELANATGEAGSILKERHHKLAVAGNSMVGYAITNRKARVALDVGEESIRFDNPLLPETRSEIALPLVVGDQVVGALDVQSKSASAFGVRDIEVLQSMANQVAVAIENARLFQSSQALVKEMQTTNKQYMLTSWSELTRASGKIEYQTRLPAPPADELISTEVPLFIRDQILGELIVQGDDEWTPEQKRLLEAVATQAAFALENARLLSESQQVALRERIATAITERIWSSQSIDGILQTTVRELGRALEATEATIELKIED
jgi:GAF domain-containing protein/HAMP domain-containing protein